MSNDIYTTQPSGGIDGTSFAAMSNTPDMSKPASPPFQQPNFPPPPYQPVYAQAPPPYQPPYQPVYMQAPPSPQRVGCFGYFLRGLAAVGIMLVCLFVLIIGGLFFLGAGIGALQTMSTDGTFKFDVQEKRLSEAYIEGNKEAEKKIAVITVEGVIGGELDGYIAKQIKQVQKDKHVVAVVLRIDSPGGTLSGSDYYHHLLTKMKNEKDVPVIVSMGSVAASGGYYLAVTGDEIYAEPTTITGSIGVIVSLFNGTELCKKIGVESTPITSGPLKAMGSFAKTMSEEERKIWQNLVDDSFGRFKEVIRDGRKFFSEHPETLDKLATGQIYTAKEATDNKLVDKIGFIDDALAAARDKAGVSERDSKVIRYKKTAGFLAAISEADASGSGNLLDSKTLSDKTTPKIYALCPYVIP
ncbi:MAG: signal peptide peptidase SppA [Planctomycetaceae bacterium]|jgi:protease-4|nr:signal peptide peptidase SppA [Planctomycetaceae bacterium]